MRDSDHDLNPNQSILQMITPHMLSDPVSKLLEATTMTDTLEDCRMYAANLVKTLAVELLLAAMDQLNFPTTGPPLPGPGEVERKSFARWDFEPTICMPGDCINIHYHPSPASGVYKAIQVQLRCAQHMILVPDATHFFGHPQNRVEPVRNAALDIDRKSVV